MMLFKSLFVSAVTLMSLDAAAHPLTGKWQGPCETRGALSAKFTYVISDVSAANTGIIAKTKIYYDDPDCTVYNHTGRQSVAFALGAPVDGVYPLDVTHRGTVLYDIVQASEDGKLLTFGTKFARTAAARPTELSADDRVFDRVED